MGYNSTDENGEALTMTDEEIRECWKQAFAARPYRDDDEHYQYFDCPGETEREHATAAIYLLKRAGLWTEEDEKKAFG